MWWIIGAVAYTVCAVMLKHVNYNTTTETEDSVYD